MELQHHKFGFRKRAALGFEKMTTTALQKLQPIKPKNQVNREISASIRH